MKAVWAAEKGSYSLVPCDVPERKRLDRLTRLDRLGKDVVSRTHGLIRVGQDGIGFERPEGIDCERVVSLGRDRH